MKTTLDLNDSLVANANANAKALAARQRTSLTRLIEEGLQLRLRSSRPAAKAGKLKLPVFKGRGGLVAGLEPGSNKAMLDAADGASLRLMPMVVASFLRLVTNPKIFVQPTPVADAMNFLDALLGVPGIDVPSLGAEWPIFRQSCLERKLVANSIPDAWLAACVIQLGEHLVTFDTDFRKLLNRTQVTVLSPA